MTGSQTLGGVALNGVASGAYRGTIEIDALPTGGLVAINLLSLEDYVAGVVPAEVSASWPAEALKAQAVAARTYALATHAGGALFDQYPDTRSQEYKGVGGEAAASTAAVRATSGQTLVYGGAFATTYFFSTSGGHTENVENVFYGAKPQPYLVGVDDPYESSAPLHRWRISLSPHKLQAELGGLCKGSFRALHRVRHGTSPRIVSASVDCSRGSTQATGVALRQALGLYDTWFTITRISSSSAHPARAASLLERLLAPRLALAGSVDPAPADGVVEVERRGGSRFVPAGYATTSPQGDYSFAAREPGVYRVRVGDAVGPAVSVG